MHCQDPECLTGCPTGAIGRFGAGQIDIFPSICIGCGDCATQCPYNAITMVPRNPKKAAIDVGFAATLRSYLRVKSDPLPPAVEQTDDLVAVKCNLCTGTPLNPPEAKTRAYSCEENCPTGALARINPREYFTEIEQIEGLMLIDSTHAIGRNIHRSDPARRVIHTAGILLTAITTALVVVASIAMVPAEADRGVESALDHRDRGPGRHSGGDDLPCQAADLRKRAGPLRY